MSMGELWQAAASWQVSYRYAPDDSKTTYLAVFFLGITAESIVGPLIFTGLVIGRGLLPWLIVSVALCVTGCAVGPLLSDMEQALTGKITDAPQIT
jgi:hypothetical protein